VFALKAACAVVVTCLALFGDLETGLANLSHGGIGLLVSAMSRSPVAIWLMP
jgi:hypothetical protein